MTSYSQSATKSIKVKGVSFAYRELGPSKGAPIVLLHHLTANLDDWDPSVLDGLAQNRRVIAFDNRGVGKSEGKTPDDVTEMAHDAEAFIDALGLRQVDLLGFSLGGFIAQVIAQERPSLVRKIIIAGAGPAGGTGIAKIGDVLQGAVQRAGREKKHPKHFLFFTPSASSQKAADEFLARLNQRSEDKDAPTTNETIYAQVVAISKWGSMATNDLQSISQPVLVANGDGDVMVPTSNSFELFSNLPNATLAIYPDASHGGIFQYHTDFLRQATTFLDA